MATVRSYKLRPKGIWTLDEIKAGFEAFATEYGRYPTALEIDAYEFLPSSRSIQRSYGGLVQLRGQLFPDEIQDFTSGEYRSKIAGATFRRSQAYEASFYDKLCTCFEPIAVHEHKVMRPGQVTSDFFIYVDAVSGVCLDLFYAKDLFSVRGVINDKLHRYGKLECQVVFVVMHDGTLTQADIDDLLQNKQTKLPYHIKVLVEENFWGTYIPSVCLRSDFTRLQKSL